MENDDLVSFDSPFHYHQKTYVVPRTLPARCISSVEEAVADTWLKSEPADHRLFQSALCLQDWTSSF